jgi:hypothetical protein
MCRSIVGDRTERFKDFPISFLARITRQTHKERSSEHSINNPEELLIKWNQLSRSMRGLIFESRWLS